LLAATAEDTALFDYSGNIEGHDLLTGRVDVAVTDGFTGNVALKSIEGTVRFLFDDLRAVTSSGARARLGSMLLARPLRELHRRLADDSSAGAVLLGLNGTIVVTHGASDADAVAGACRRAHALASGRIVEQAQQGVHATGRSALRGHRTRRGRPPAGDGPGDPATPDQPRPPPCWPRSPGMSRGAATRRL
jgi:phosphate acyltransferase